VFSNKSDLLSVDLDKVLVLDIEIDIEINKVEVWKISLLPIEETAFAFPSKLKAIKNFCKSKLVCTL